MRACHDSAPTDQTYGAVFHTFYGETGGVVAWPALAIGTEQDLDQITEGSTFSAADLRWSPADWTMQIDPTEADDAWAARVEAFACTKDDVHWEEVYSRFLRTFAAAAKTVRRRLVESGAVEKGFVAVAMDEEWALVPLSLTAAQVRTHFPELDEEQQELARLDRLGPADRAAALADVLDAPVPGAVSTQTAAARLVTLGDDAVAVAVERLPRSRDRWRWAKVLADVGLPDPDALDALTLVLGNRRLPETDRAWSAAALARLGGLDRVRAVEDVLPRPVLRRALAAPYTSFRDHAVTHAPLDYGPLEAALADDAALAHEMLAELEPGSGFCTLRPEEVATARAALDSPFEVVRRHATEVLADL